MTSHRLSRREGRRGSRGKSRERLGDYLPVFASMMFGLAVLGNGRQEHASVTYYVLGFVAFLIFVVLAWLATAAASELAARSAGRRPRWLYGLLALLFLAPAAVIAGYLMTHPHSARNGWTAIACGILLLYCSIGALLMLGRVVFRGSARRIFWLFPPAWLDHQ